MATAALLFSVPLATATNLFEPYNNVSQATTLITRTPAQRHD